jgi:hypothetical protein
MPTLYWDASALVKRYCFEDGTETVAALFALSSGITMVVSIAGFAEMYSILVRKRNGGVLDRGTYLGRKAHAA